MNREMIGRMCGIALGVSFSVAGLVLGSVGSAQAADTSQVAVDCPPGVTAAVGDSSVSLAAPSLPTRLTCPIIGPLPVVRASLAGGLVTVNTAAWD